MQSRKEKAPRYSYIDFYISFGGLGGSLDEIREANYRSCDGKQLYKRPYAVQDIPKLLECLSYLSKIPQTKVNKLREVLYEGETSIKEFIQELRY